MQAAGAAERWLAEEAVSDTDDGVSVATEEAAAALLGGYLSGEEESPMANSPTPPPAARRPPRGALPQVMEPSGAAAHRPRPVRESLTDRIVAARRAAGQRTGPQRPRRRCPDPTSQPSPATARPAPRSGGAAAGEAHVVSLAALPPRQAAPEPHAAAAAAQPVFNDAAPFTEEDVAGMMQWEGLGCAGIR